MILLQGSYSLPYYNIVDDIRRRLKSLRSYRNRHQEECSGASNQREEENSQTEVQG